MSRNTSDTAKTVLVLITCLAAALHAWTPTPRPGFKLDTLDANGFHVIYDSLGRFSDSANWSTQSNGVVDYINRVSYRYEGTSCRLVQRIHFSGTPEFWYSGQRTYDTGYVRRDSQGRDSCMDISGSDNGSYGSVGSSKTRISNPNVIRWDKLGRVIYDGTESTPMSYGYDDHGWVTSDSAWYSGKPYLETSYRYDQQGRLVFRDRAGVDTGIFEYSPEGYRTNKRYYQGKLASWSTFEKRGDTAFYSYGGTFAGQATWYLKDAWGDTVEQGNATTDSGFRITYVSRDSITRDQDGNAVLIRSFKGNAPNSLSLSEKTRYVWSHALPGIGIADRNPKAHGRIARIEWCDLRGRVLASTDRPWETFKPQSKTGLASIVERRLTADGHLVTSRILLTR